MGESQKTQMCAKYGSVLDILGGGSSLFLLVWSPINPILWKTPPPTLGRPLFYLPEPSKKLFKPNPRCLQERASICKAQTMGHYVSVSSPRLLRGHFVKIFKAQSGFKEGLEQSKIGVLKILSSHRCGRDVGPQNKKIGAFLTFLSDGTTKLKCMSVKQKNGAFLTFLGDGTPK